MNFAGIVLAGGKSRRMGSPKHLVEIGGQPLWRRQADLLRAAGAHPVGLSMAAEQTSPAEARESVIRDLIPDCGPLSGIAAALEWSPQPLVLVLAVDLAAMSGAVLREICAGAQDGLGRVPQTPGGIEPLAALYPATALGIVRERLRADRLAARGFAEDCVAAGLARWVGIAASAAFDNLNRPRLSASPRGSIPESDPSGN